MGKIKIFWAKMIAKFLLWQLNKQEKSISEMSAEQQLEFAKAKKDLQSLINNQ